MNIFFSQLTSLKRKEINHSFSIRIMIIKCMFFAMKTVIYKILLFYKYHKNFHKCTPVNFYFYPLNMVF